MAKRINYAAFAILIKRGLEYCQEQGIEPLAALGGILGSIAVIAISVIMFFYGAVVVIGLLFCVVALITWICVRVAKWNRRRLAKKRYGIFSKFLATETQIIKKKVRLETLFVTSAKIKGGAIVGDGRAEICCSKRSATMLSFQLQVKQENSLKCVHVVLEQVGKDVVARADWAACTSASLEIGYDFSSEDAECRVSRVPIASNEGENGCGVVDLRFRTFSSLKPLAMPNAIWKDGAQGRWGVSYSGPKTLKISTVRHEKSNHDVSVTKVERGACEHQTEAVWRNPRGDKGEKHGGRNMSNANVLVVRARGEVGGEKVCFFMGGLKNRMVSDTADERERVVCLKKKWKTYCIPLHGLNLTRVKTAFGLRIKRLDAPIVFYIDNVVYKHSWWRAIVFGIRKSFMGVARLFGFVSHSR